MRYSFQRYLAAKKTVDDRALHPRLWDGLAQALARRHGEAEVRIAEAGAGIGTMLERMLERNLAPRAAYLGVDEQAANVRQAPRRLRRWARANGLQARSLRGGALELSGPGRAWTAHFEHADALASDAVRHGRADLVVAHAFLDLVDLERALARLLAWLAPGGLFYFTINYDGETIVQPAHPLDERVLQEYHRTMDERQRDGRPSGDSRTGRRLPAALQAAGAQVLDVAASDWVVYPRRGAYPEDEAYFLHDLVHTVEGALRGCSRLESGALREWVARRHQQVERGELIWIAHQLDVLGTVT